MANQQDFHDQMGMQMQQALSALETIALKKIAVRPYAYVVNGVAVTIPDKVKAFNIVNLGLNGEGVTFVAIPVTGITGLTAIPKGLKVFGYTIENDQNNIKGPIVVTPPTNNHVLVQYLL